MEINFGLKMRVCKFSIFEYRNNLNWTEISISPSVCLLVFEEIPANGKLKDIVEGFLNLGVIAFVVIGENSNLLENAIDAILEDGDDSWLGVATTKYPRGGILEAVDYAVNTIFRKTEHFQCFIVFDEIFHKKNEILHEIEIFKKNSNANLIEFK